MTVAELSRQVRDVLLRFQGLTERLENQFIRKDIFEFYEKSIKSSIESINALIKDLDDSKIASVEHRALVERVAQLEDDKKWLVRLILGCIILAVLGVAFAAGGKP